MDATVTAPPTNVATTKRPIWLSILAVLYLILGIVTFLPQFYYLLYFVGLVTPSPHADILGQIWYWYGHNIDTAALKTDSGTATGAIEDAFMLGPLYITTFFGLWGLRPWARTIGFITAGGGFYAIMYFILTYSIDHVASVKDLLFFWPTILPYAALPVWLATALIVRRKLFPIPTD